MGNGHPQLGNQPYYDYKVRQTFNLSHRVELTPFLDD